MKRIELQELKNIELDMVKFLKKVCEDNDIHFYMVGGTLLGAVRHEGFIPWDDDIDVAMPRSEYLKLEKIVSKMKGPYKIQFFNNCDDYGYSSPKLVDTRTTLIDFKLGNAEEKSSVFIDIFLYDGMGNSSITAAMRYWILKLFKRMVFLSRRKYKMETPLKTILFFLPCVFCRAVGSKKLNAFFNFLASRVGFNTKKIVACVSGRYGKRELFNREVFERTVLLRFEDTMLPAPVGYHEYLSQIYGDYMKIPPEDRQISNHTSEVWWN